MTSNHQLLERGRAIVERLGITLQELLGSGGFGSVYSAVAADGTRLAVKFCKKTQFIAYLEREAKIQLAFKHENLVRLYHFLVCATWQELPSSPFDFLTLARLWLRLDRTIP